MTHLGGHRRHIHSLTVKFSASASTAGMESEMSAARTTRAPGTTRAARAAAATSLQPILTVLVIDFPLFWVCG